MSHSKVAERPSFLMSGALAVASPSSLVAIFSAVSVFSAYSVASFGSIGSALSIGSVGSVLSVFSVGCVLSVNSVCSSSSLCCATQARRAKGTPLAVQYTGSIDSGLTAWVALGQSNSDCHLPDGDSTTLQNTYEYYGGKIYAFREPPLGCQAPFNSPYGALAALYGGKQSNSFGRMFRGRHSRGEQVFLISIPIPFLSILHANSPVWL